MRITVGLSEKVGQPRYGSLGASCYVEFETDSALLEGDLDRFQQRVQSAYLACRQAVREELSRVAPDANVAVRRELAEDSGSHQRGRGDGHAQQPVLRGATPNQLRAIKSIARQLELDLGMWLHLKYSVNVPEELSIRDASRVIDDLRLLQAVAQEAMTAPEHCPLRSGDQTAAKSPA